MTDESSLFDIPPPKFGRYRVQQQLGVGTTGPVFLAEDPETHGALAIKALRTFLPPEANQQVVDELLAVVDRLPTHPSIVPFIDAGLEDKEPYLVAEFVTGEALDVALREFGPGAIGDLLPRVRSLAEALDLAAEHGLCHGALHPRDVIVSEDSTFITGIGVGPVLGKRGIGGPIRRPYTAPEVARGQAPTAASDQFSLAALTFEWLFGELIPGSAAAPLEVPELPDVESDQLAETFTTALAPQPSARFINCRAFVDGLTAAVPAIVGQPVAEGFPDVPIRIDPEPVSPWDDEDELDPPLAVESHSDSDLSLGSQFARTSTIGAVSKERRTFGVGALVATLLLGMGVGLAGGYWATTTSWSSGLRPSPSSAEPPVVTPSTATGPAAATPRAAEVKSGTDVRVSPPPASSGATMSAAPAEEKKTPNTVAAATSGRLQILSTPTGATVQVDGVTRGVTPLSLTDLQFGSRTVSVSSLGYVGAERRVTLSKARPSQALEVRLSRARTAAATTTKPAPVTDAASRPAAEGMGSLVIESRPPGAAVTVNGVPRGTTPITIGRIPVGSYTVTMRLSKYQPVSMVVRVAPGERARAAATLTLVD